MKRRVISLLSMVAMICTMVVFAMPATAASVDAYQAIVDDAQSGADALKAAIDANADDATLLQAAKDATIVWKTFDWKEEPYPRYAFHEAYEAAGYDGKNWSITEAADWFAMDTYAISQTASGDYFTGVTFHLTNNVEIGGDERLPLGVKTQYKMVFAGTIDGHGYSFSNVKISIAKETTDALYFGNTSYVKIDKDKLYGSIGLIGFFAGTIQNFGIESGTIKGATGNAGASASTFGAIPGGRTATFNNVWSGADLYGTSNPFVSALAAPYKSDSVTVHVNGFVYYGEAKVANNTKYPYVYAIMGGASAAPAEGSSFANIITYPTAPGTVTAGNVEVYMLGGAEDFSLSDYSIKNVYGLKKEAGATGAGVHLDYRNKTGKDTGGKGTSLIWDGSLLKAAADSNSKQTGAAGSVYFTATEDGNLRPSSSDEKAVVEVTLGENALYVNKGTELTKAQIAAGLGLSEGEITSVSDGEKNITFPYVVPGNVTLVPAVSQLGALTSLLKKYENVEGKYLTDASVSALEAFIAAANAATTNEEATAVIEMEKALNLETYSTYPMAAGKEIPAYSLNEIYGDFNEAQEWVIKTAEDWEAMRKVADAATEDYFEGVTFHLVDDVEFNLGSEMAPMGFNDQVSDVGFAGTINGHGYGFNNINVQKKAVSGNKNSSGKDIIHTGLFLRLADCTFIDFGLNSGIIRQISSNADGVISSFGTVVDGKAPSFERVWSSVYIGPYCSSEINGLVGILSGSNVNVKVNGFVFDGVMIKGSSTDHKNQDSYAVLDSKDNANPGTFQNIITDFEAFNGKISVSNGAYNITEGDLGENGIKAALFAFTSEENAKKVSLTNVYGVQRKTRGILDGYAVGSLMSGSAYSASFLTKMSAAEVAWTINSNPTDKAVYYKLNAEGQVRPIAEGKSEGKIIKIAITGDTTKNVFANEGSTIDLKAALGYKSDVTFELVEGNGTIEGTSIAIGEGDVTVKMTNPCVAHDYEYTPDGEKHSGVCALCGDQITEACELGSYVSHNLEWNALTHTGACVKCAQEFTQNCVFEYKNTDAGYKYVCACGCTEDALAPMVAGDANEKDGITLSDAVQILKKIVGKDVTINERNSDLDGVEGIQVTDIYKIILYVMGDQEVIDAFAAAEDRINEANFYNEKVEVGNIKMDGAEGTNERYTRTDYISVSKGDKVVFGPIRMSQAVMGMFYDAEGNAIELINVNNEKLATVHTFKAEVLGKDVEIIDNGKDAVIGDLETKVVDGLVIVSIEAPEGAAYVRIQANAAEAEQFYVRVNNEFSLVDFQCRTNGGNADALGNALKDQLFLTIGDSLCSAARDTDETAPKRGWEGRIRRNFGATTVDCSQGGSAISTVSLEGEINEDLLTGETATDRQWIVSQLHENTGKYNFEYILLEGGGNDAHYDAPIGTISESFDPATFDDESTFAGAMEKLIFDTIKLHGDTAAIGFMSAYPMPLKEKFADSGNYFAVAKEICEKWNVSYLDIYTLLGDFDTEKYTTNGETGDQAGPDYVHAGAEGYDMMQAYIDPFVTGNVDEAMKDKIPETLKPIDQEIYLAVQTYANK